jgi:hypothetical protein
MSGGNVDGGDERRLKPWGVAMLPHDQPEPVSDPEPASPAAARTAKPDVPVAATPDRAAPPVTPLNVVAVGPSAAAPNPLASTAPELQVALAVAEPGISREEDAKSTASDDRES